MAIRAGMRAGQGQAGTAAERQGGGARRAPRAWPAALAGLAAAALLAGCGDNAPEYGSTAPCPRIALLAEGADQTRFLPGAARDLSAMVVEVRITGFDARCDFAPRDRRRLEVFITPRFEAERGPASTDRSVDVPWFIALTDADDNEVLDHQQRITRIAFAANTPRAGASGQAARVSLPLPEGRVAQNYIVRLSLQLSADELDHNRSRRRR